jgi:hypothetical protein
MPSTEITLATDSEVHAELDGITSLRMDVTPDASEHFISRSVGPVDLTDFSELRLWFRTTHSSQGIPNQPFQLRLELGSAAMPIGDPGNGWRRYLPTFAPHRWQFVRMALDDLDPLVAGAVDAIQMTCVNVTVSWTAWLDDLIASDPQMVADVDAALVALLDGQLNIGGPVPAQVHVPGQVEPAAPWLRIVHYDVTFSDLRTTSQRSRTDFTDDGYRLQPESVAYDIYYRIEPVTGDRSEYAQMIEFILDVLGHRRSLLVNGVQLPLDRFQGSHPDDLLNDVPVLRYRVATRQERGTHQPVAPVDEVTLATELTP